MPYNFNIPQANDQISVSQGQILANFQALGAIAGNANPNTFSLNAGTGFNYVYLSAGANPPAGTALGANNAIFSSNVAFGGGTAQNEIYINKQNQATQVQIPITASILDTTSAPTINSNGWTFLASGIVMKWGFAIIPFSGAWALGNNTVVYPVGGGIPAFTGAPFSLQVTLAKTPNAAIIAGTNLNTYITCNQDAASNLQFIVDVRQFPGTIAALANIAVYWLAIGRGV